MLTVRSTFPLRSLAFTSLASGLPDAHHRLPARGRRHTPNDDIITTAEARTEDNLETAISADLMTAARPQDAPADSSPAVAGALELRRSYGTCATRTYGAATKTLTIDFGPTNCRCPDGRYRRGKMWCSPATRPPAAPGPWSPATTTS